MRWKPSRTGFPEGPAGPIVRVLERRVTLARGSLVAERIWRALWPASGLVLLFLAAAWLGFFAWLTPAFHAGFLVALAIATVLALVHGFRDFRLPARADALRRLDVTGPELVRAASAFDDRLAAGADDAVTRALWEAHRARLAAMVEALRVEAPEPQMAERDRYGLRGPAVILAALGLLVAGTEAPRRLADALAPDLALATGQAPQVDAWITPPAYTAVPPMVLSAASDAPVTVPEGSVLTLKVNGLQRAPVLAIGLPETAPARLEIRDEGAGAFAAEATLTATAMATVTAGGRTLAAWPITVTPDADPTVAFSAPPKPTPQRALTLGFRVADDYAVARVVLRLTREGVEEPLDLALTLPKSRPTSAEGTGTFDLTGHDWAGLPVQAQLIATDEAGQEARSDALAIVLPERFFGRPLARALIEQRRLLTAPDHDRLRVARALEALSDRPEGFITSSSIYLGLRSAYHRLLQNRLPDTVPSVRAQLWDLALAIESGDLDLALAQLRQLQKELAEALARNAPAEEIERLMQELRAAIDRYLEALSRMPPSEQARRQAENAETLSMQDLQRLLDALEESATAGDRGQAQQMLAFLDQLLSGLRPGGTGGEPSAREQAMDEAMRGLSDLMGRQRQLMDRTHRENQNRQDGEAPSEQGSNDALSGEQGGLGEALDALRQQLEGAGVPVPEGLGQAEGAMDGAEDEIGRGRLGAGVEQQRQALDALRQGAEELADAMQGEGQGQQQAGSGQGTGQGQGNDPFGRANGNGFATDSVEVPDAADLKRAREILDELRRRAGERGRPMPELDYLERLLRRF